MQTSLQRSRYSSVITLTILLLSHIILPSSAPTAEAVPSGADIYFFAGNESGGRYAVKSNGDGTFSSVTLSFTYGDNNRGGAVEDYDNDGDLDFVGCNDDIDRCHLFVQTSPGIFTQSTNIQPSGFGLAGVEAGFAAEDFNQDGNADVLLGGNQNVAVVYFGDGSGGFPSNTGNLTAPVGSAYAAKDSGDLDGNGYPDIVLGAAGGGNVYAYYNTAGTFSAPILLFDSTANTAAPFALTVADFDGDGYIDIISGGETSTISLWKGDATGTTFISAGVVHTFGTQSGIDSYDFDGDGDQDLVSVARATGAISYHAGNGDGTFAAPVTLGSVPPSAFGMAAPPAPPIRSRVEGFAFKDMNSNGTDDDGSIPVELISMSLTGTDYLGRSVNMTTLTGGNGRYAFTGVPIDNGNGYTLTTTAPNPPPMLYSLTTPPASRVVRVLRENTNIVENFGYLLCTDADGDGFATEGGACGPVDCNDANAAVNPGASEICDGLDNNCNGADDEGFDADGDGYYTAGGICGPVDCNDANAAVHPGAAEICDGIDNDCDGTADDGTDADGDRFSVCAGDCNDSVQIGKDAAITIDITDFSSSGPGANMTNDIYVGGNASPFGSDVVTIPLTVNGIPIVDVPSSGNVAGLHVMRGVDSSNVPFVRIRSYGHNKKQTREVVSADLAFVDAKITGSTNGPDGPYELQGDGKCEKGKPGQDEFTVSVGGSSGSICSTTNVHSDTVTLFYSLTSPHFCNALSNPSVQCAESRFSMCGACIHPGAPDSFGDGIDSNCDGSAECSVKTDYEPIRCSGEVTVRSDAELDRYLSDFGLDKRMYRNLRIAYNLARPAIEIHSPCKITIKSKMVIEGDSICIEGRKGVRTGPYVKLNGAKIALLSQFKHAHLGAKNAITAVQEFVMRAFSRARVGHGTNIATGIGRIESVGSAPLARVRLGSHARITAEKLDIVSSHKASLGAKSSVTTSGNFHMDALRCFIHKTAAVLAGSTSGRCFSVGSNGSDDDEDEENDNSEDGGDEDDE